MIAVHLPGAGEHRMIRWKTRELGHKCCMCTLYPQAYSGPGDYIFKFMGRESEVVLGMAEIKQEIEKGEKLFKKKIPLVDPREAVFPISKVVPHRAYFFFGIDVDNSWKFLDDVF